MDSTNDIRLGRIYACIDGDRRYSTTITVTFNMVTRIARIERFEMNPVGGMDGTGPTMGHLDASLSLAESAAVNKQKFAEQIVKGIKQLIDSECGGTVKRYGKPTKNFVWDDIGVGLSVRNCLTALEGL